jgi:hypothetical protein
MSVLLASVLVSGLCVSQVGAQSRFKAGSSVPTPTAGTRMRYQPNRFAGRAGKYYSLIWEVDSLNVKWAESGEVIRFSRRVLDAENAKPLNDTKSEPSLIDPKAGVKLVVPSLISSRRPYDRINRPFSSFVAEWNEFYPKKKDADGRSTPPMADHNNQGISHLKS